MKTTLLVSAAAAALFAAAPALAQDFVGSVGYTHLEVEIDGVGDGESDNIDGSVAIPVSSAWTVTLNAQANGVNDDATWTGSAHLSALTDGDVRIGAFVGATDAADETLVHLGVEMQKYFSNATLTAAASYGTIDDVDADIWSFAGDAAFYPMANLRLNAGIAYNNIDGPGGGDDSLSGTSYNVGAEYQVEGTPFSLTAGYDRTNLDEADLEIDTFLVGVRFGSSLQARDRSGANLGRIGGAISSILGGL